MSTSQLSTNSSRLLTKLLQSLRSIELPHSQDAFNDINVTTTPSLRPLLLTLHCLFPNDLLSALDTLDRGLVTQLVSNITLIQHDQVDALAGEDATTKQNEKLSSPTISSADDGIYYVRSSQQLRGRRFHNPVETAVNHYEVRLRAWNCSCAAFAYAAFSGVRTGSDGDGQDGGQTAQAIGQGIRGGDMMDVSGLSTDDEVGLVGGLRIDGKTPMCKHLLACLLVENCAIFGKAKNETVTHDEKVGWTAEWA